MKQTISRFFMLCMVGIAYLAANAQVPNNEIWYTTTDGQIAQPNGNADFGANVISNTYNNGKGVIKFDGDVTKIGPKSFQFSKLSSIELPNSIKIIGNSAFEGAKFTELKLPSSLVTIENSALCGTKLTSITIPKSVRSIGNYAFCDVYDLKTVTVLWDKPISIESNVFFMDNKPNNNIYDSMTLYIPEGTYDEYAYAAVWYRFGSIIEVGQCKKPTIAYVNGKLKFHSETSNVKYEYSIADTDISNGTNTTGEIQLSATYTINVKATSANKTDSETATATLCWINQKPEESGTTGTINIKANPVLIQSENGVVSVSGIDGDESVSVYSISGMLLGKTKSFNGKVSIPTKANQNDIVIVKFGDNSVKVKIQ